MKQVTSNHHRRGRQRGSSALEAALIIQVFFMLIFAIIDFSMAVFMKNLVQSSVRDGVRAGITGTMVSGHVNTNIKNTVEASSLGFVKDAMITITYTNPVTMTQVTDNTGPSPGNILTVTVSGLSWAWMCPFARDATALAISASSADLMEPTANGTIPTP